MQILSSSRGQSSPSCCGFSYIATFKIEHRYLVPRYVFMQDLRRPAATSHLEVMTGTNAVNKIKKRLMLASFLVRLFMPWSWSHKCIEDLINPFKYACKPLFKLLAQSSDTPSEPWLAAICFMHSPRRVASNKPPMSDKLTTLLLLAKGNDHLCAPPVLAAQNGMPSGASLLRQILLKLYFVQLQP